MTSDKQQQITVGVLALQGSFREHISHMEKLIQSLKHDPSYANKLISVKPVRTPIDLQQIDGLIIGGGESTTISILLQRTGLLKPLQDLIQNQKLPTWGTCAGLILLCDEVTNTKIQLGDLTYKTIGGLDVSVERNSFGRQLESFTENVPCAGFTNSALDSFDCVFIRAPVIKSTVVSSGKLKENSVRSGRKVHAGEAPAQVLATVSRNGEDLVVAVRKGKILGTSFHPELIENYGFHKWFLDEFVIRNSI
ncbi:unnamed protein product [Ambrosiozyma monospora]|uniref:Unnamed protein product n=1 Tax=Ambrosiozyma monospora TaxID=43982 RepID=A0A9W6YSI4_AMBMO|nr:unnamed protein product [Ambrosiozyma monospora]